jgi:hypothetical protein
MSRVSTELGEFSAIAAAYSIDRDGDQIVRGAFRKTIDRWRSSGKRIPLHWNHSRAGATGLRLDGDHYTNVKPIDWSDDCVPEDDCLAEDQP